MAFDSIAEKVNLVTELLRNYSRMNSLPKSLDFVDTVWRAQLYI